MTPPFPDKRYDVIYADPAWDAPARKFWAGQHITDHYPTMPVDEIMSLPVSELANDHAWLYLWAVDGMLDCAIDTCRSWGFDYKKSFVWDKQCYGLGVYNRGQHEQLLICKRGKHSDKPDIFRHIINKYHPNTTKIELFARVNDRLFLPMEGWDYWGNEA